MHLESICAAFVTYNRRETTLTCIRRLLAQTRPPEFVFVMDGGSSDGTAEAVRETFGQDPRVRLYELDDNPGNAAGMAQALRQAADEGIDAVWILDDDSWPQPQALEKLLATSEACDPNEITGSLVVTPDTGELAWPVLVYDQTGERHHLETRDAFPPEPSPRVRGIWLGALIPATAIRKVGTPDPGLFIRGEDEEYPARLTQAGYGFRLVFESVLEHPKPSELQRYTILGRHFFHEKKLPPWKSYYFLRNRIYCRRRFASSALKGMAAASLTAILGVLIPLLSEDQKGLRLRFHLRAACDGLAGRLGKQIAPGQT